MGDSKNILFQIWNVFRWIFEDLSNMQCQCSFKARGEVKHNLIHGISISKLQQVFFIISDQRLHRFKLRFQAFKNEMVETVQHGNGWNAPKIKNFLVGQRPKQRKHFRNVSIWNFKSSFCLPSNLNWRPDLVAGHFFTWNPASPSFLFPSSEHTSKRW